MESRFGFFLQPTDEFTALGIVPGLEEHPQVRPPPPAVGHFVKTPRVARHIVEQEELRIRVRIVGNPVEIRLVRIKRLIHLLQVIRDGNRAAHLWPGFDFGLELFQPLEEIRRVNAVIRFCVDVHFDQAEP